MNSVLIGVDFAVTDDDVKLLELNTEVGISSPMISEFDFVSLFNYITTNNITTLHLIYKEVYVSYQFIDVIKSQWVVIDYNEEAGIDACVFYRNPRPDENWLGQKIQGIGHDGEKDSKKIVVKKMVDLLEKDGYWTEVSDKMEEVIRRNGGRAVTDLETLQKLFPNSNIEMLEAGQYQRTHLRAAQPARDTPPSG